MTALEALSVTARQLLGPPWDPPGSSWGPPGSSWTPSGGFLGPPTTRGSRWTENRPDFTFLHNTFCLQRRPCSKCSFLLPWALLAALGNLLAAPGTLLAAPGTLLAAPGALLAAPGTLLVAFWDLRPPGGRDGTKIVQISHFYIILSVFGCAPCEIWFSGINLNQFSSTSTRIAHKTD